MILWLEFKPPKVKLKDGFCIPAFEACSRLHVMQVRRLTEYDEVVGSILCGSKLKEWRNKIKKPRQTSSSAIVPKALFEPLLNCVKTLTYASITKRGDVESKTYSSRDSHVVTHRSTNLPFNCLCMAERTGCPVFS
ncbi:hypothetical protein KCU85_g9076, partial [Aureobasidium melanogenum]